MIQLKFMLDSLSVASIFQEPGLQVCATTASSLTHSPTLCLSFLGPLFDAWHCVEVSRGWGIEGQDRTGQENHKWLLSQIQKNHSWKFSEPVFIISLKEDRLHLLHVLGDIRFVFRLNLKYQRDQYTGCIKFNIYYEYKASRRHGLKKTNDQGLESHVSAVKNTSFFSTGPGFSS